MKFLAFGFAMLCFYIISLRMTPSWDKKWDGNRLFTKGGITFLVGWLIAVASYLIDNHEIRPVVKNIGMGICVVGMPFMLIGYVRHIKMVLSPVDPKADVDPGHALGYILCPYCQKIKIRKYANKIKCPRCKKKINIKNFEEETLTKA